MTEQTHGQRNGTLSAVLRGRCPRCGEGRLYRGFIDLQPACNRCGLDYSFIDAGDGPAVFIILFVGFAVVGGALVTEVAYQPPIWVHVVLWLPLTLILGLGLLRPLKSLLIAQQYRHRAAEGRLEGLQPESEPEARP